MPTYEYACKQCGHRFEVVQSMLDDPLSTCPDCGGELRKVLHAAGIVFKGSGFYATDNRAKPKSDTAAATADSSKDKDTKGSKDTKDTKDTKKEQTTASGSGSKDTSGSSSSSSSDTAKSSGSTTKKESGS